jgi:hypothetical protein
MAEFSKQPASSIEETSGPGKCSTDHFQYQAVPEDDVMYMQG